MKTYVPKTLAAARRKIRELQSLDGARVRLVNHLRDVRFKLLKENEELRNQRRALAKLAGQHCFDNPLVVYEAQKLRDQILKAECQMTPEGKPIKLADNYGISEAEAARYRRRAALP